MTTNFERRVISEALGWYHRRPFSLNEWMATPDAMVAQLRRIDAACEALIEARKVAKKKARGGSKPQEG